MLTCKTRHIRLNGQQFPPPYEPKPYSGPEPEADIEDGVMHHGSCHCGAITIALKSKPFEKLSETVDEDRIVECNCSFCTRVRLSPNGG